MEKRRMVSQPAVGDIRQYKHYTGAQAARYSTFEREVADYMNRNAKEGFLQNYYTRKNVNR